MKAQIGYLQGQMLIAMPTMGDPRFERSLIYVCAHNSDGAMGLVVNKLLENITFPDLLRQLAIDGPGVDQRIRVHFGGPVETGRGFVLHSADYNKEDTMLIAEGIGLTATIDVLKAMANGEGPQRSLIALGYAGWGAGQLDAEIQANGWLHAPADPDLLFGREYSDKWAAAVRKIGIDLSHLSSAAGHA